MEIVTKNERNIKISKLLEEIERLKKLNIKLQSKKMNAENKNWVAVNICDIEDIKEEIIVLEMNDEDYYMEKVKQEDSYEDEQLRYELFGW